MDSRVKMRSTRQREGRRRVSGAEEALLFAVGGDYSPTAIGQHTPETTLRRQSTTSVVVTNDIEILGRLRRERRNTIHQMEVIKAKLENTQPTPDVSINLNKNKVTLTNDEKPGHQVEMVKALKEESEHLQHTLKMTDAKLKALRAEISTIPSINCERERARNTASLDSFIADIFMSVREGDLACLKIRIAALDLEQNFKTSLTDLLEESSQLPILHVALMCDQHDIVSFLIKQGGADLTTKSITSPDSVNLTPFYIALLHGNFEAVRLILDSLPNSSERAAMINQISGYEDYDGILHEELPLFSAITGCMENMNKMKNLLEYLVENGADLTKSTTDGNTLLHLIVKCSAQKKYANQIPYLKRFFTEVLDCVAGLWWEKRMETEGNIPVSQQENQVQAVKYLLGVLNKAKRTPFTLAAQHESPLYSIFVQWKNVMRFPDPRLGYHFNKANTYDITSIASVDHKGSCQLSSVMNIVAHNKMALSGTGNHKEDLLLTEPLKTIVKQKWSLYRWPFYIMGLLHIIHMTVFTSMVFEHETINSTVHVNEPQNSSDGADMAVLTKYYNFTHLFHYASFLILPTIYLWSELQQTILVGTQKKFKLISHGNGIYRVLILMFSLLSWVWLLIHEIHPPIAEVLVAFILITGWLFLVFFLRGIILPFKNIQVGIFPSMVQRMFVYDVIPFLFLTVVILIACSTAFHAILIHSTFYADKENSFQKTIYLMVKYLCGLPNPMDSRPEEHDIIPKILLMFYGLITTVLLINMLIAAMNRSYELIRDTKFSPLYRQRLAILLLFEQRLPKVVRRLTLRDYTIMINPRTGEAEMFLKISDTH